MIIYQAKRRHSSPISKTIEQIFTSPGKFSPLFSETLLFALV